jgi:hypothetical protein
MDRTPVISSMIRAVGYDPHRAMLEIEFRSGKIYEYESVSEQVYLELLSAGSKGRYFDANIDRKYLYRQV